MIKELIISISKACNAFMQSEWVFLPVFVMGLLIVKTLMEIQLDKLKNKEYEIRNTGRRI